MYSAAAQDQRGRAQPEDRPVDGRLERDVGVPEDRQLPEPDDHGQAVAETSALMTITESASGTANVAARTHLAADAGRHAGEQDRDRNRAEHQRVRHDQRGQAERQAVRRARCRPGGVQRTRAAAVGHEPASERNR